MSASKRPSTSSLRRYLTSRPYIAVADIRRRFGLEPDRDRRSHGPRLHRLPEREATKLHTFGRYEVGVELSVEVTRGRRCHLPSDRALRHRHRSNVNGTAVGPRSARRTNGRIPGRRGRAVGRDLLLFSRTRAHPPPPGSLVRVDAGRAPAELDWSLSTGRHVEPTGRGAPRPLRPAAVVLFGPQPTSGPRRARAVRARSDWARSKLSRSGSLLVDDPAVPRWTGLRGLWGPSRSR